MTSITFAGFDGPGRYERGGVTITLGDGTVLEGDTLTLDSGVQAKVVREPRGPNRRQRRAAAAQARRRAR